MFATNDARWTLEVVMTLTPAFNRLFQTFFAEICPKFQVNFPELSYITKTWIIVVSSQEFSDFPQFFQIFQPMTLGFQLSPPPSACRPPWPPRSVAFPALRRRSCERWTFLGAGQRGRARLVRENPGEIVIEWDLPSSKHTKTMENHNF